MLGVGGNFGAKAAKYECLCQVKYLCLCLNNETTILIQKILLKSIQLKDLPIISGLREKFIIIAINIYSGSIFPIIKLN